jgi:hypothetical protein
MIFVKSVKSVIFQRNFCFDKRQYFKEDKLPYDPGIRDSKDKHIVTINRRLLIR